jgi:AcrR family transcriptional regulator
MTERDHKNATTESVDADVAGSQGIAIRERILVHARDCFQSNGLRKTTIEDIAEAAGVVRQTIYNHFANKQDIFDQITLNEMLKVHEDMLQRLQHPPVFADKITEAILASTLVARDNPYLRRSVYEIEAAPPGKLKGVIYQWQREHWRAALESGRASGELTSHIAVDDIVSWLSSCQWMLQIKLDHAAETAEDLRRYIRNFVVEPLLAHPDRRVTASDQMIELRGQIADLKDILAEQAITIRRLERARKH